jgi:hypothetical protein
MRGGGPPGALLNPLDFTLEGSAQRYCTPVRRPL